MSETAGGGDALSGVRVLELGGIGPVQFAGMWLADLGADVVRVDRPGPPPMTIDPARDVLNRGKRSVVVDLRAAGASADLLDQMAGVDVIIEGFRPGVVERLGLGPEDVIARNPRLVYGRMTGWGQHGPRAQAVGHDINYLALTGALHAIGQKDGPPVVPLNLLGDYGGGGAYLATGVLAALFAVERGGPGRVVDAAIVDGVTHLLSGTYTFMNSSAWRDARGVNVLDGGAPFYAVYRTTDARHVAVGAIEPKFYEALGSLLGVDLPAEEQYVEATWPETRRRIAQAIAGRTRDAWAVAADGTDACLTPVLSMREAVSDPHLSARGSLQMVDGAIVPGIAPRLSGSSLAGGPIADPGQHDSQLHALWS